MHARTTHRGARMVGPATPERASHARERAEYHERAYALWRAQELHPRQQPTQSEWHRVPWKIRLNRAQISPMRNEPAPPPTAHHERPLPTCHNRCPRHCFHPCLHPWRCLHPYPQTPTNTSARTVSPHRRSHDGRRLVRSAQRLQEVTSSAHQYHNPATPQMASPELSLLMAEGPQVNASVP